MTERRKSSSQTPKGVTKGVDSQLEKKTTVDALAAAQQDLIFVPNPAQRKAKARFWSHYEQFGAAGPDKQTALQITREPAINRWWALPGFQEWFRNEDESKERLRYLWEIALDAAEEILLNPDTQPSARVNMIKIIGNLAGKEPDKGEPKFLDTEIQKMDSQRLLDYVKKHAKKLLEAE